MSRDREQRVNADRATAMPRRPAIPSPRSRARAELRGMEATCHQVLSLGKGWEASASHSLVHADSELSRTDAGYGLIDS